VSAVQAGSAAERLRAALARPDAQIDLAETALLAVLAEHPGLDVAEYRARLATMGAALRERLRADIAPADAIVALNRYLFDELGFRGSERDYYDPRNSCLNEVLDRRIGIPITLSIVYITVGRALGLKLDGVSFPGHFLVRAPLREGTVVLDPYGRGISLGMAELQQRLRALHGGVAPPESVVASYLKPATPQDILVRLLRNLKTIYLQRRDWANLLSATDRILIVDRDLAVEHRDRGTAYLQLECFRAALADFEHYLACEPQADDADEIRRRVIELRVAAGRLN